MTEEIISYWDFLHCKAWREGRAEFETVGHQIVVITPRGYDPEDLRAFDYATNEPTMARQYEAGLNLKPLPCTAQHAADLYMAKQGRDPVLNRCTSLR